MLRFTIGRNAKFEVRRILNFEIERIETYNARCGLTVWKQNRRHEEIAHGGINFSGGW